MLRTTLSLVVTIGIGALYLLTISPCGVISTTAVMSNNQRRRRRRRRRVGPPPHTTAVAPSSLPLYRRSMVSLHGPRSSLADRWEELRNNNNNDSKKKTMKVTTISTSDDDYQWDDDNNEDGFLLYLQQYETSQDEENTVVESTKSAFAASRSTTYHFRTIVFVIVLGATAAAAVTATSLWFGSNGFLAPSLWKDLKQTMGIALAVNLVRSIYYELCTRPWQRRNTTTTTTVSTNHATRRHEYTWIWILMSSLTRPDLWLYLWDTFIPSTIRTIRHMLVAELWNRLFTRFFAMVGTVLVTIMVGTNNDGDNKWNDQDHPFLSSLWMDHQKDKSFLAMALKRGTKKMFQSVLQKHLNQAILHLGTYTADAVRGAVEQIFPLVGG